MAIIQFFITNRFNDLIKSAKTAKKGVQIVLIAESTPDKNDKSLAITGRTIFSIDPKATLLATLKPAIGYIQQSKLTYSLEGRDGIFPDKAALHSAGQVMLLGLKKEISNNIAKLDLENISYEITRLNHVHVDSQ
ncbi:MAG TPA: hypothetical protein VEC16_03085 [Alphaproteobacteria bacterium]|nr:hypothetical protein [Alphaproteobacteria bacterium]